MGERYSFCKLCNGTGGVKDPVLHRIEECPRCDGSGKSGDAIDLIEEENRFEHEQELREIQDSKLH